MSIHMPNDLESARAARLMEARKRRYERPSEAADALGIARGTYYGLENGNRPLTEAMTRRIAPGLRTTAEWLLFGRGETPPVAPGKNSRNLSLFLTNEVDYFIQISKGACPVSNVMVPIDESVTPLPPRAYFLHIGDNAMASDKLPAFPKGAKAIIDPDVEEPSPGGFVHAVLMNRRDSVTRRLRRSLKSDGRTVKILVPLNPDFEEIELHEEDGDFIVGAVKGVLILFPD